MSLRTTLTALLLTFTALTGCAASTPTATEGRGLTPAESARLVELNERLRAINASPDSTLSADERREILVEVQRLQNKQEAPSESESKWRWGHTTVLVGLAVIGVVMLAISSIDFDFDLGEGGGG